MDAHFIDRFQDLWNRDHLLHGLIPPSDALVLMSNDYLDLLSTKSLRLTQAEAVVNSGGEPLMSAVFSHGESPHNDFERRLAKFMTAEDGVLCQSGWAANVGLIQTLASESVPVYLDVASHASIWEGAIAAGARVVRFTHNNANHARAQVAKHGPGIIAVDSIYSTDGSVAPLAELAELTEQTGSVLVVDESHSLGTHGTSGTGMVCDLGLTEKVHFRTVSLAKTFAGRAGFVACSTEFKEFFKVERAQQFSVQVY